MCDDGSRSVKLPLQLVHQLQDRLCCSSSFRSCSRIAPFSARISATSLSRLVGRDCGACARAELTKSASDAKASAVEHLPDIRAAPNRRFLRPQAKLQLDSDSVTGLDRSSGVSRRGGVDLSQLEPAWR